MQITTALSHQAETGYLEGQLLIATPVITGPVFQHSVILMCAHNAEGAMGIIVNHIIDNICYGELFEQLDIPKDSEASDMPVYYGGPVEINRGFVVYDNLGDPDNRSQAAFTFGNISVSSSLDTLRAIAEGHGPKRRILTLGYAGWSPGQLEAEMEDNSWFSVPASGELVFATENEKKWERAALSQGIDITKFSTFAGHA